MRNELHAVYANCEDYQGRRVTFRVGQPASWDAAQARWRRLDYRRLFKRAPVVRHARRRYTVQSLEVRAVDPHGRGLGSERHGSALLVPYRAVAL